MGVNGSVVPWTPALIASVVLGVVALGGVIGIVIVSLGGHPASDALLALTTGAIGALGGLLSPAPAQGAATAGDDKQQSAGPAKPEFAVYITFLVVLGLIALVGMVGLIYLAKVSADLQLSLIQSTAVVGATAPPKPGSPAISVIKHVIQASSSAGTNIFQIPTGIVAIASACVGAIGALFVPSPASH